jgi:hypothetical protein
MDDHLFGYKQKILKKMLFKNVKMFKVWELHLKDGVVWKYKWQSKRWNVYWNMMLEQWHVSPGENEGVLHHDMGEGMRN